MTLLTPSPEQQLPPQATAPTKDQQTAARPPDGPLVGRRATIQADLPLRYIGAAASFGCAAIHFAVMPEHWLEWKMAGLFFGVLAWVQVAYSVALLTSRRRLVVEAGLVVQLGTIGVWALSRTAGMPFGPQAGQAEPASFIDVVSTMLEVVVAVAAVLLLMRRVPQIRLRAPVALAGVGVLIAGVVGTTTASLVPSIGGHQHAHGELAGHSHAVASGDIPAGWVAGCHSHAATTGGVADLADVGHAAGNCTDAQVTSAQRAAAELLAADTTAAVANRYPTLQAAERAGYQVVNQTGPLVHVANHVFQNDGRMLDPQRVESLVYVSYGRISMLLGAMYIAEPAQPQGPLIGGALTSWHIHTNLCVDPVRGTALNPGRNGACAPGSAVGPTLQMLHVWTIPYQGGPFADISTPALITAVTSELQRRAAPVQRS
ncbi:MAG TPA: hypothetical protein VLR26_08015 [Frankiaceae bacterium]|nr:hypothetical protein [Frankiaceae bacterium]